MMTHNEIIEVVQAHRDKYIPWTANDWREFNERQILLDGLDDSFKCTIKSWNEYGVFIRDSNAFYTYEELCKKYIKNDKTPCGKIVE